MSDLAISLRGQLGEFREELGEFRVELGELREEIDGQATSNRARFDQIDAAIAELKNAS